MSAYIVVEAVITDFPKFAPYTKVVPPLVAKMGGEYISIAGEAEALEGDWGETKIVLHRWPNMQAARDFWFSPEYEQAKKLRQGTGTFRVMLVDGVKKETLE